MMDLHEIERILARITYKPGWKITIEREQLGPVLFGQVEYRMQVTARTVDADNPTQTAKIASAELVNPDRFRRAQDVLDFAYGLVTRLEMHELSEFFRVDGRCHVEPHPERRVKADTA